MVFGDYPCCGAPLTITLPENLPRYLPENCPGCGAKVWHKLSRIDPQTWLEAEFLKDYEVDGVTKQIRWKAR